MRFSLQDMVRRTLAEAEMREKYAQVEAEAEGENGSISPEEKKKKKKEEEGEKKAEESSGSGAPETNDESLEEKTSSVFVEKLASAVAYCNTHFIKIAVGEQEPAPVATPKTTTVGPGIGATALDNTIDSPTTGMQSTNTGQAKNNQPPLVPGSDVTSPGQVNPATALETDINSPPGGSEDWSEGGDKMKQAQVARVRRILYKMAEDGDSSSIKATHSESPSFATQAEEGVPSQPGEVSKQESMVGSNESAMNYTKQQAKAVPNARMGEVLSEPAQKKSTDPVLHENLDATSGAGVKLSSVEKVAAARSLLRKIAEEGAKEDASPEEKEKALKLQEILKAKQQEKDACGVKQGSSMPLSGGY
jgi:hypothetical protein